MVKYP